MEAHIFLPMRTGSRGERGGIEENKVASRRTALSVGPLPVKELAAKTCLAEGLTELSISAPICPDVEAQCRDGNRPKVGAPTKNFASPAGLPPGREESTKNSVLRVLQIRGWLPPSPEPACNQWVLETGFGIGAK